MKQIEIIDLYNLFIKTQNQFNAIKRSKSFLYKDITLHSAELQILGLLKSNNTITITDLAIELYMTKSAISQMIKKLYTKKLISKCRNIENERIVQLEITELGKSVINHFLENRHNELGLFLNEFSDLEKTQYDNVVNFFSILERMFNRTLD